MNAPFPDAKPWPKAEGANPRVALGNNNPPLEERIIMEFEDALREHDGLIARIDAMVEKADGAGPCTSDDLAGRYGDFIKMAITANKVVEAERETLNRPLLTAQRMLKARADLYSAKALGAAAKVRAPLDAYVDAQKKKREDEERRLAEIQRQADLAAQAIIDEANRKALAAAETERKRLQDIEDARVEAERVRLQAIEDERAAAEAREAKVVEVEAAVIEVQAEPVIAYTPAPAFVPTAQPRGPIRGDYGTAVSTVETWHVEVVNIRQVPDAYLRHPTVVEALQKVIGPQVRGKNGLREIKGCRIYSTVGSSVR